jgi:hypothetical protein
VCWLDSECQLRHFHGCGFYVHLVHVETVRARRSCREGCVEVHVKTRMLGVLARRTQRFSFCVRHFACLVFRSHPFNARILSLGVVVLDLPSLSSVRGQCYVGQHKLGNLRAGGCSIVQRKPEMDAAINA